MATSLTDVTGSRGEKVLELCLTDYRAFSAPLFRPGFLGDKWPALDFYVELASLAGTGRYFFVQAKTTARTLSKRAKVLRIPADVDDVESLLKIPAPTYIFGIHEPSRRVFARAVHSLTPKAAIGSIPLSHELTSAGLQRLHDEVLAHWNSNPSKPTSSVFS